MSIPGKIPNLFVVGAPKCGTTAMYYYLQQHPEIFMSPIKEPPFFDRDIRFRNDVFYSREDYLKLFEKAGTEKYRGECHVWNLYSEEAPCAIKALSPEARIIIMIRRPDSLVKSLYRYNVNALFEDEPELHTALALEDKRVSGEGIPPGCLIDNRLFYTRTARFTAGIGRYRGVFGADRVHVILAEDMLKNPRATFSAAMRFLDVNEPGDAIDFSTRNVSKDIRFAFVKSMLRDPPRQLQRLAMRVFPGAIRDFLYRGVRKLNSKTAAPLVLDSKTKNLLEALVSEEQAALWTNFQLDTSVWNAEN